MTMTAAVITVSDSASRGLREDRSGPSLCGMLKENGWEIIHTETVPDEQDNIRAALLHCTDVLHVCLAVTTGGTGFSPRDVTPEATKTVIERETPGIPEAMRAESMRITPRGCLSREAAGIRGGTIIINCPGSEKAACECLAAVLPALRHGAEILRGETGECGGTPAEHGTDSPSGTSASGRILAVCISERRGTQKHAIDSALLRKDHGIEGDAHAGTWHRQVSLLGIESVRKVQEKINFRLEPGAFAENILTEGLCLYRLPVGTRLKLGTEAIGEVTQIGKECHEDCAIRRTAGDCVMPREGIFIRILRSGNLRAGDKIEQL